MKVNKGHIYTNQFGVLNCTFHMDCGIQMFMFRMSEGDPFLVSLLKNQEPKESLLLEGPEFDPGAEDPFELPNVDIIEEFVEFVVVFEVLVVEDFELMFILLELQLSMIPDDPNAEVDASNLVATQLNSLVCRQAKVIITGKTEKKNKAILSLTLKQMQFWQKLLTKRFQLSITLTYFCSKTKTSFCTWCPKNFK